MNTKQVIGFIVMAAAAIIVLKLLPALVSITFSLLGLLVTIAIVAAILYAIYLFIIKSKNDL